MKKERVLGDRQSRAIDNKLKQLWPGYKSEKSFEANLDRVMIPEGTQLHKVWVMVKGEINSLKADLESMKEEKYRWQKEANSLKRMSEDRINTMKAERGLRRDKIATLKKELAASEASKDTICEYSKGKLVEIENLNGEIRVLTQDLQGTTALKDRFKRRMELYKGRLDALEDYTGDATDEANEEEYGEAADGRHRSENDFDQRNHYREM